MFNRCRSRSWFYGGSKTGEPCEKTAKHKERPTQLTGETNCTHMSSTFQNQYNVMSHDPFSYNPIWPGLTLEFSAGRQHPITAYTTVLPKIWFLWSGHFDPGLLWIITQKLLELACINFPETYLKIFIYYILPCFEGFPPSAKSTLG